MAQGRVESDLYVNGRLTPKTFDCPSGAIANAGVSASAGIVATKLQHQYAKVYAQPNSASTTVTQAIHVCYGATGTIIAFEAGSIVAATGNATHTVDLKINGSSALSAVITLDSGNTARVVEAATITSADLVAGDLLEIVTVATVGSGALPTGFYCQAVIREDAA